MKTIFKILTIGTFTFQSGVLLAQADLEYMSDKEVSEFANKSLIDSGANYGGTSIRYQSYAASGMTNLRSTDYSYGGGGCVASGQSYLGLDQNIDLPHGSRLVSATFFVNDNNATQSTLGLLFAGGETFNEFFTGDGTSAAEAPGFTSYGGFMDYTISDTTRFVTARLELGTATGDAEICGVRIGYITPDVASDVIFVSNFFR